MIKLEGGKLDKTTSNSHPIHVENISLNNINVRNFKMQVDIIGGDNRPSRVSLNNINIWNSSNNIGIGVGSKIYDTKITNCNLHGNGSGIGLRLTNNHAMISGVTADNYSTSAWIAGEYDTPPTVERRR